MIWAEYRGYLAIMVAELRVFVLLLTLSTCFGCGAKKVFDGFMGAGVDNSIPPSALVDFTETTRLDELWSRDVVDGTNELFIKLVPAILNDKIFIADTRGNIAALYAKTGKNVWREDSDLSITGGPGADENLVMVGTDEGDVLSLSTENGDEVWRSKVSSEILSSPRESDGVVVVRTIDGKIFALDATTGERIWIYDRTVPALTLRGTSTPVIANGIIIAGFDGGRISALELKTGKLVWETKAAVSRGRSELERMVDIDAQPLIVGDAIYITTFQANVAALSLENGQILWQRDISSHAELSADAKNLYVTDEIGNVWALDRFSGTSIWKQEKLTHRHITGPAILGDRIVVGDFEGYLHWLDKETGDISARTQIDKAAILTQPIVENNILFAYSSGGTLSAFIYEGIEPEDFTVAPVAEKEVIVEETIAPATEEEEQASTDETTEVEVSETENTDTPEEAEEESSLFGSFIDIFTGDDEEE
ncbi:MAG TPA: outer membrane protein assembly factor BamB [Thiotrichaceae bacterium]|jgi:outer membrane protein assembly factor BamB|nr:outer membrane protein assembly factor BamB [Thiotrichaceae bacterium]HIM08121.1 outer membrane protein assembly factor BamB [Gammaproteobacteria bacterium]